MTKTYILDGLCCQGCAGRIAAAAKNISGVRDAAVDFQGRSIAIDFTGSEEELLRALAACVTDIDEDVTVKER